MMDDHLNRLGDSPPSSGSVAERLSGLCPERSHCLDPDTGPKSMGMAA